VHVGQTSSPNTGAKEAMKDRGSSASENRGLEKGQGVKRGGRRNTRVVNWQRKEVKKCGGKKKKISWE